MNMREGSAHLTLLLGGVRGGKSARAVTLAAEHARGGRVLFVATAQAFDDEMTQRIAAHRRERPTHWDTLESPLALPSDLDRRLRDAPEPYAVVLIDCVTLWVSNILLSLADDDDVEAVVAECVNDLLKVRTGSSPSSALCHWIVVSNEVGLGVVPPTPLGRRYRDALGRANQLLAAAADDVTLMVAGLELPLKRAVT
jgi:adenosylcobinamide kinase/adenosylcobinamide-phosphate guanylyltransferase